MGRAIRRHFRFFGRFRGVVRPVGNQVTNVTVVQVPLEGSAEGQRRESFPFDLYDLGNIFGPHTPEGNVHKAISKFSEGRGLLP